MLNTFLARYRAWQLRLDTIRYLSACDDRILADMGVERGAIATVARRNATADRRLRHETGVANAAKQHTCGLTA